MGNIIDTVETADLDSTAFFINANSFSWKFENVRSLKPIVGKCIKSNKMVLEVNGEEEEWQVLLYPDGFSERVKGYCSLWVKKLSDTERNVSLGCEIYNSESKLIVKKWTYDTLALETVLGWTTFCKRSVIEHDEAILQDGTFRLDITVAFYNSKKNAHASIEDYDTDLVKRSTDVCRSLKSLLSTENFSDVTIVAGDEKFKVHKAVLSARSEVFHLLLKLKSRLGEPCILTFDDLSKETVKQIIRFIYTGEIGNVSYQVACELFYAANKYQLNLLEETSAKILANSLNQDNVLRVLSLADRNISMELKDTCSELEDTYPEHKNTRQALKDTYPELEDTYMEHKNTSQALKNTCLRYITSNSLEIQKQKEWKELMQKDPKLANNVVEAFAKRRGTV